MQTRHIYCGTSLASALEHFHTWCIGWSTASAVQLRFGNETALAAEVTEVLPQALKHDPRTDGSYARLKACSTHRLYTRCETAIANFLPISAIEIPDFASSQVRHSSVANSYGDQHAIERVHHVGAVRLAGQPFGSGQHDVRQRSLGFRRGGSKAHIRALCPRWRQLHRHRRRLCGRKERT